MHHIAHFTPLVALSKHQDAGIAAAVIAAVLIVFGVIRLMAKAAGAALVPLIGVAVAVVAVLLFTRTI